MDIWFWMRLIGFLYPTTPENMKTEFWLYNRPYRLVPSRIIKTTSAKEYLRGIQRCRLDFTKKTVFLIHGFTYSASNVWIRQMISALIRNDDVNVIAVEWYPANDGPMWKYPIAARNALLVGVALGQFIEKLEMYKGANVSNMHLIGISLGAHVAGAAGRFLHGRLGRISGLDPARPLFTGNVNYTILDRSDAQFVDILHTNTGNICPEEEENVTSSTVPCLKRMFSFGITESIGHVDIYANGGRTQPGCLDSLLDMGFCSHYRVADLYLASIKPECDFKSCLCDDVKCEGSTSTNCTTMGYTADPQARGDFYLETSARYPFCKIKEYI